MKTLSAHGRPRWAQHIFGAAALLATTSVAHAQAPAATFASAVNYGTRGVTRAIVVADVNGDGKPDLLTANQGTNAVSVLLGTGNGTFGTATTYGIGTSSSTLDLAVADVNSDGQPDILTANAGSSTVSVLLNTGNGTFGTATAFSAGAGSRPNSIAVADVNGDGKPDILTANTGSDTVGVLLGTGSGTFGTVTTFSTGAGSTPSKIVVADVNGDGQLDLLTRNEGTYTVGVLLGTGMGTFGAVANYSTGGSQTQLSNIAVADVNGDGKPDLLATNYGLDEVAVLLGTGMSTGTFGALATFSTGPDSAPLAVTVADVNGDGKPDLLTANQGPLFTSSQGPSSVGVLLGNGSGSFGATTSFSIGSSNPLDIAAADVNGDGKPDILTANFANSTASVLLNTTVYAAPTLTSLNPTSAAVGTSVTLTGTNLSSATAVSFNGMAATTFAVVNATTITATVPTGATTGNVTVTTPGGTSAGVAFTITATATTWTGTVSTDWYTAGNWTQGVPSATVDATIPTAPSGGRFPAVAAGTATARNLTLNSGATLNQSGGTLALAANLTNNGTFLPTGGTVNLGTTTLSNVLGSGNVRFWNLTVGANGTQLSTSIGASVQRLLTLNGNFATNGNQFVLESTNTLAALVVNNNSNVVNGTVTVQRAIDPSVNPGLGYRHYSAPVSNSTVGDLATSGFTPVVNPAYNTSSTPNLVRPFPTVFSYDDNRLSLTNNLDMFDKGFFSPAALSDPLAVGRGYAVNIAASQLVDFQGTLNNGDLTLPLTSTRNTYPTDGGWQFLGNPYPAPLDYSRVAAADRLGLESAIYVYSSTSQYQGRYRVYINGIGNPVLPVGQAFFARVASGQTSATMTFRNSQRLTAPNGTTFQRTTADLRPQLQLELRAAASPDAADEFFAYAESGATPAFDAQLDAQKLPNPTGFNLAGAAASGEPLAIDGRPAFLATTVLPLTVSVPAAGTYSLSAAALANLPAGLDAFLADDLTGQTLRLSPGTSYSFNATAAQAAAPITGRFRLYFRPATALATTAGLTADVVGVYPNPAHERFTVTLPGLGQATTVQAELLNALGQVVRRQVAALPASGTQFTLETAGLATGVYTLRLQAGTTTLAKRVVVE